MIKQCLTCNKEFRIKPYRADLAKYCCHLCYQKTLHDKRPNRTGSKNHNWTGGKIKHICLVCNKEFLAWRNLDRKVCSVECQHINQRNKKPALGYHHTNKARENIGKAQRDEKNKNWKGDNTSYNAFHSWVKRRKGKPLMCIDCGITNKQKRLHWSNRDHKYKRDTNDYDARCPSCHKKYDMTYNLGRGMKDRFTLIRNDDHQLS